MDITEAEGNPTTFQLTGTFASGDRPAFERVMEAVRSGPDRTVVLDLTDLRGIDSFAIRLVLSACDEAHRQGNTLRLANPGPALRRALVDAKLGPLIDGEEPPAESRDTRVTRAVLHVARREENDAWVVELAGRFTFADHKMFEEIIRDIEHDPRPRLIIDMAKLEFMDSAGLSMLLIARDQAGKCGSTTLLRSPTGRVANLLRMAAVDTVVDISNGP